MEEDELGGVVRSHQCKIWYDVNRVQGTRFDKHGCDSFIQSVGFGRSPKGIPDVPAMEDESHDDHEREEDIE